MSDVFDLNSFLASPDSYSSAHLKNKNISDEDCIKIANVLENNKTIRELDLENNQIGEVGASALADALKTNTSLTELDLGNNQVRDVGASALAGGFTTNASLEYLYLDSNQIGDAGASALAEMLKTNASLEILSLDDNHVGDAGASALAEMLKTNASLEILPLDDNHVGEAGASALAEMLKTNASLEILSLDDNHVGDAGASVLAEMLKTNGTLYRLYLENNQIGEAGASALATGIKTNASLTELWLNNNQIGDAGAFALKAAWKHDTSDLTIDGQVTPEQQENLSYNEAELLFLLGKSEYPGTFYDISGTNGVISLDSNPMLAFYKQQHPEWKNSNGDNLFQKYERGNISSDDKADLDAKIKKAPGEYFFAFLREITDEEIEQSNNPERVKELVEEIRSNPALPTKLVIKPAAGQEIEPVEDLVTELTLSEEENEQATLLGEEQDNTECE